MKQVQFNDLKAQYQSIKTEIDTAMSNVINETAFIGGSYVKQFEKEFAELYGVKHVVSCANGTDSLYIIMKMLGIGEGDEVITVANSWISSAETVSQTGATPVFVDPDDEYLSTSRAAVERAITSKTKAVMMVHLHGQMSDVIEVKRLCDEKGIYVFEDCAQSHFSELEGKRAGTIGIAGSFSFYPGKNLGAYGDAGCIITNDSELAAKCKMYANHGALVKHQHEMPGINSRMDGMQAAVLSVKLPYILEWTENRIKVAELYNAHLKDIKGITLPSVRPNSKHTFHLYVIRAEKRDELKQYLEDNGIATGIHYPVALPNMMAFENLNIDKSKYPVANELEKDSLSLPIYPELDEDSVKYVAEKIASFYN